MLKRWNFLKTGFYEGIKVSHRTIGDSYTCLASQAAHPGFRPAPE